VQNGRAVSKSDAERVVACNLWGRVELKLADEWNHGLNVVEHAMMRGKEGELDPIGGPKLGEDV
jgi:hypothetical protein